MNMSSLCWIENNFMKQKLSQYKNKRFESREKFDNWLKLKTEIKIVFEYEGQDFMEWFVDTNGEVLHSDAQSAVWNGTMVDFTKIKIGECLPLQNGNKIIHKVKSIVQFPFR